MGTKVRKPTPASELIKSKDPSKRLVGHMVQYDEFLQKKYLKKPGRKTKAKKSRV